MGASMKTGGDDVLIGGTGNDVYFYGDEGIFDASVCGNDTITDFQAGAGLGDVILFSTSTFADFAAVQAATMDVMGNAVITLSPGNTITLMGVTESMLVADDFQFVA